ncbi:MAG: hypothetical protein K9G58_11570 [Bacteroidales bacterium]|nr:hypothetical protein [Bacteroidales bacterium]MCF8388683.1 hypothetical protein [Bacteroidales bacterium]MCF8398802.1 hypothetical protein [Bacteroidales bacterium]
MKFFRSTLLVISMIAVILTSCKKDNDNDENEKKPVSYTLTYAFEFPHGDYEDMVFRYMNKDQEMKTVENPVFPWTLSLDDFRLGDSACLSVKFTALPGAQIDFSGKTSYSGTNGGLGQQTCGQTINGLSEKVTLECNAPLKITE